MPPTYDPDVTYVRTEEWVISTSKQSAQLGGTVTDSRVTLEVFRLVEDKSELFGSRTEHHPEHHGKMFSSHREADKYAVEHGLLVPYVPRFQDDDLD